MGTVGIDSVDWVLLWSWFLLSTRTSGLFLALPGIGNEHVPAPIRASVAMVIGALIAGSGVRAQLPDALAYGIIMLFFEFVFGYLIGALPAYIIGGLAVSGQIIAGAIGLAQANMIDPSLGESVSIISRIKMQLAVLVFLLIDGHHVMFRALANIDSTLAPGSFQPDISTAYFLLSRLETSFQFAVIVSAPILVTMLVTQFVLGLLTKSVPQINIFIISLPLTLGLGLFILVFMMPSVMQMMISEFSSLEELVAKLIAAQGSG